MVFRRFKAVKGTEYEHLYSLHYGDWWADAGSFYAAADACLARAGRADC